MAETERRKRSWRNLLVLLIAFTGAIVSFAGALYTYGSQAQIPGNSLWPLPGFVLIDWIVAGSLGFIATFFCLRKASRRWLRWDWVFTGSFIPLIILGAFSIGPLVLISFLLFLVPAAILTLGVKTDWAADFGLLMVGSIINLAILMGIITASGQAL